MPPVSIITETTAIQASPTKAAIRGKRKCNSVNSATTNPTSASHLGRTPVPKATKEVLSTMTEVVQPCRERQCHEHEGGAVWFESPKALQDRWVEDLHREPCR